MRALVGATVLKVISGAAPTKSSVASIVALISQQPARLRSTSFSLDSLKREGR
jgi:hypothetical protein